MNKRAERKDLLSGSILKHVIRLATPMIIAFIFVTSYQYVDRIFVSQLGDVATAAIGMAFTLQMVVISLGVGIGNGVNSFISRNLGANKNEVAENTILHAFLIAILVGLLLSAMGLLGQRFLFRQLGADGQLLEFITAYLTIIFLFTPVNLLTMVSSSVYQGWGDTVSPMKFMLLGNIINLTLDPLLIFGLASFPELGIQGAAWATGLGRAVSLLYVGYQMFFRHQPTQLKLRLFRLDRAIISGVFQVGLPASVSQMLTSVAMMFVFYVLNPFGSDARAAYHRVHLRNGDFFTGNRHFSGGQYSYRAQFWRGAFRAGQQSLFYRNWRGVFDHGFFCVDNYCFFNIFCGHFCPKSRGAQN